MGTCPTFAPVNLTTVHSLWLAPLCLALGIGLAWWLYRRAGAKDGFSPLLARTLAVIRATAIALIAFFLLEPMVRVLVREVRKPVVVLAHDGSASLLLAGDTTAVREQLPKALQELADRLADRYEVRAFTYGERVREGLHFEQGDGLTDMGRLFREVYDRFMGPDLGAVIITGDGIYNRGRDPRLEVERLGVPVHAVALGDTTVRPDVVLRAVEHNRINYLGNEFPLLARIEARHLAGNRTKVTVSQDGRELAVREVAITGDPYFTEVPFTLKAPRPGLQRFTVTVSPVEGEITGTNNRQDIYIEVLDDRQRVLLLGAGPHPDLGAIRQALNGLDGYATDLAFAAAFTGVPEDYDLILLHRLPTVKHPMQALLQRAKARGVPLCFVLGQGMDMAAFNAQSAGVEVTGLRAAYSDAMATVDRNFTWFTLDEEQARALERFPPLQVPLGQYALGRSANTLLTQRIGAVRTPYPLLAMLQQGERRMATISGEGLWRWRVAAFQQHGDHGHFDRLIHKLVQFLALKVDKNRFRVEHAGSFTESDAVLFNAELYNATYELVNGPEVAIVLTDEDGREFPYAFSRAGNAYRLDAGRLPAGRYTWQARTELDAERYTASGELVVEALVAELLSTVADHGLLADLAARTGGVVVPLDGLTAIEQVIRERREIAGRSYAYASFSDLIGLRWLFFVILALLTAAWALRPRNGAY